MNIIYSQAREKRDAIAKCEMDVKTIEEKRQLVSDILNQVIFNSAPICSFYQKHSEHFYFKTIIDKFYIMFAF
jgi:hypothetical protein